MDIKRLNIKNVGVYSMLLSGFSYLGLGIFFITQKGIILFAVKHILNILAILFTAASIFQIMGFSLREKDRLNSISRVFGFIVNLFMAGIIYFKPQIIAGIFPVVFGIYAVLSGIIRFLTYLQYKNNNVSRRYLVLLSSIVLIGLGILIIFNPLAYIVPITNIVGIFLLFMEFLLL